LIHFQNNKLLKVLLLGNNSFEDEGARLFKIALSDNATLEVLDLSWNNFKNKGATLLAEGIQVGQMQDFQKGVRSMQF
jgi:Ran GTPase-activating protein (RanGAP) involved in mRNA processing and transport